MPLNAGLYKVQFRWMRQQTGVDPDYGEPLQAWIPFGILWGYITGEAFAFSEKGSQTRALIHLRGLPALASADRLEEVIRGGIVNGKWVSYSWTITGLQQDDANNELRVEVFR